MPVDAEGMPLCFNDKFKNVPAAMVWLWKDHTSFEEAKLITETAAKHRPEYLAKIGGVYSSEWYWSKFSLQPCRNMRLDPCSTYRQYKT